MKNKIKKILSQGFDDLQEGKTFYENTVPKIEKLLEEARKEEREKIKKFIHTDAVIEFNSTPDVGEKFDIEKHNHANKILNEMSRFLLDKIQSLEK